VAFQLLLKGDHKGTLPFCRSKLMLPPLFPGFIENKNRIYKVCGFHRAFTGKTFRSSMIVMSSFPKLLVFFLIGLFLSFSFNAYACLVPIYGGMKVHQGSDCTMPGEEPASQFCDGFKSLAVQSSSDIPSGELSHFFLVGTIPSFFPVSVTSTQFLPLMSPVDLPPPGDILVLISVFRI